MSKKKRSNLGYYIKEGVSSIFTHGFMSFASVAIIVACLVIMGSFLLVAMNINEAVQEAESRNQMLALIDDRLTEEDARELEWRILVDPNVADATFVTRYDALAAFVEAHGPEITDGLEEDVLRHRFVIDLEDIALMVETEERLLQIPGIDEIIFDPYIAGLFVTARNVLAVVFLAITAVLFVVSIFIIANTIKLATFDRREEIAIMRMVGATKGFIRWPFVFQGFILGLTGAIVAFFIQWGIYGLVADQIFQELTGNLIQVLSFGAVADFIILVFAVVGFIVGTLGSVLTIRKYLKV
ncbi:MAG: ABC transporter permease [Oscillospiraceae bacterium]|nr:ABC transporter permease [Oscillospiraceae bacterium]